MTHLDTVQSLVENRIMGVEQKSDTAVREEGKRLDTAEKALETAFKTHASFTLREFSTLRSEIGETA
eukprot:CAMPEP_0175990826 /NCGR_PEP_ID=MMETSP0108-20121206/52517_1 /TAXON_ID=195067 ORGANISM="Goniomonas pacifica, Strain CCMP1869" /NCGR_SAMPLE_ID=MMETSP0108 /ASSEMBLY_ACC=CAM_ASM_000204 /LENGTH=66 /DNA_ID=CAMNT_0017322331 /DNA_START=1 /DNA_END=197 /DNA_ORIENTATION=+